MQLHYTTPQLQLQLKLHYATLSTLHYTTLPGPHGTTRHHTAPHGTTRHHTTPHHTTPHHTTPHHTTPHHTTPHHTTPHHTTPHHTTPHHTTPHHTTPHHTTPHHTNPRHATPRHATPRHATPHHTTPHHTTPHHTTPHHTTPHHTNCSYSYSYSYATVHHAKLDLDYTTLHCTTLHYPTVHNTTFIAPPQMQLQLHCTNQTTPQLQLHYAIATATAALHHTTSSSCEWGDRPGGHCNHCNHSQKKTQLQPPSVHQWIRSENLWFTTNNPSYRFLIFETSAAALRGTTGICIDWLYIEPILCSQKVKAHQPQTFFPTECNAAK